MGKKKQAGYVHSSAFLTRLPDDVKEKIEELDIRIANGQVRILGKVATYEFKEYVGRLVKAIICSNERFRDLRLVNMLIMDRKLKQAQQKKKPLGT